MQLPFAPVAICQAPNNGQMYVMDLVNHIILKMDSKGILTHFAGIPGVKGNKNGEFLSSTFNRPSDCTVDLNGNLYIGLKAPC